MRMNQKLALSSSFLSHCFILSCKINTMLQLNETAIFICYTHQPNLIYTAKSTSGVVPNCHEFIRNVFLHHECFGSASFTQQPLAHATPTHSCCWACTCQKGVCSVCPCMYSSLPVDILLMATWNLQPFLRFIANKSLPFFDYFWVISPPCFVYLIHSLSCYFNIMGIKGKINAHQLCQSHGASAKGLKGFAMKFMNLDQFWFVRHLIQMGLKAIWRGTFVYFKGIANKFWWPWPKQGPAVPLCKVIIFGRCVVAYLLQRSNRWQCNPTPPRLHTPLATQTGEHTLGFKRLD